MVPLSGTATFWLAKGLRAIGRLVPWVGGALVWLGDWIERTMSCYAHAGNMRFLTNSKDGDLSQVELLYTVGWGRRFRGALSGVRSASKVLGDQRHRALPAKDDERGPAPEPVTRPLPRAYVPRAYLPTHKHLVPQTPWPMSHARRDHEVRTPPTCRTEENASRTACPGSVRHHRRASRFRLPQGACSTRGRDCPLALGDEMSVCRMRSGVCAGTSEVPRQTEGAPARQSASR